MTASAASETDGTRKDEPLYTVSVAAQLVGMHAQTLRQYDKLGLVSPRRTPGRGRRYSANDVQKLREVQRLSQDEGINLAGVQLAMKLGQEIADLEDEIRELQESLRAASTPARRVFSADSEGLVRLRAPRRRNGRKTEGASTGPSPSGDRLAPQREQGGAVALVATDSSRNNGGSGPGRALVGHNTMTGWQLLAELSLERTYQARASASARTRT